MFSKDKIKGFIMGAVVTSLLSATVAFATPIEQVKTILYNNIKIYIDGNQIQPKDAQGNPVEPFIMDGTTYLPVRAVANAFGKTVRWDGATSSVYVGKSPDGNTPAVWLQNMEYLTCYPYASENGWLRKKWVSNKKDNLGNEYENGGIFAGGSNLYNDENHSITYSLNAKYSTFKGKIALSYDSRDAQKKYKIKFFADEKLIYTSPIITGGSSPVDFNLNMTGVLQLKILRTFDGETGSAEIGIVEAGLYE